MNYCDHKSLCVVILTGVTIQLQEKLLQPENHHLKPDVEFLSAFAGVVGSKWPSLATTLSLSESEIREVKGEGSSQQDYALQMLKKWASREDATYGQLCQRLRTFSFESSGEKMFLVNNKRLKSQTDTTNA